MSDITFLNLELSDEAFVACVRNEQASLKKIVRKLPTLDRPSVSYVDATNEIKMHNAMVSTKRLLHIAGHGDFFGGIHSGNSQKRQERHSLKTFADYLDDNDEFLDVDVVVLDSCWSSTYLWRKQLSRIVGENREMIFIGSAWQLPFDQAETFFNDFYEVLLERKIPAGRKAFQNRVRQSFREAQDRHIEENSWWSKLRIFTLTS